VPFTNVKNLWSSWIPFINDTGLFLILKNLEGNFLVYNTLGNFIGETSINEIFLLNKPFQIIEILTETGLQIKADPGIRIIYLGFGMLMISTLISYISYTQFWILNAQKKIFVSAETNRAQLNLRLLFLKFISLENENQK
jgi:cytochrome c biogenesis protein